MQFIHNNVEGFQKEPLHKKSLRLTIFEPEDDDPNYAIVDINIFDDNNTQMAHAELIFNKERAYAVLNRMHFYGLSEGQKIEVVKELENYLFGENDLPFNILALGADPVEHGISEEVFPMCGFVQLMNNFYMIANPNFEGIVKANSNDQEITDILMNFLQKYNLKKEKFLDEIRHYLEEAYIAVYEY